MVKVKFEIIYINKGQWKEEPKRESITREFENLQQASQESKKVFQEVRNLIPEEEITILAPNFILEK